MKYGNIYFLGIGGIGMSAIARYCRYRGHKVSGYDRTPSELTHELEAEGMEIHYEDRPDLIPQDRDDTLVIYTPAVPRDLREMQFVMEHGYKVIKRSRALGEIAEGQRCLAVAGTHGKTTTSTLLAHMFTESGEGCSAFLGGISKNYGTNLLVSDSNVIVAEADEFDRSFLQLHPEIAVITAMDADHLDIYSDLGHVTGAFKEFASQVSGTIITKPGLDITRRDTRAEILRYSFREKCDFYASSLSKDASGHFSFDLNWPGGIIRGCRCGVPGWVNVENSIAAAAVALTYGMDPEKVKHAAGTFAGVKRRFDFHINIPGCTYIDDYAHHPKEIAAAVSSIRDMFPGRKITAVFQPHLYTRTRDFADDFAEALSHVDKLILLDIYPAREEPIPGVTSEIIFRKVNAREKVLLRKEELLGYMEHENPDVLVTFGAGDIDRLTGPLTEMLEKRYGTR